MSSSTWSQELYLAAYLFAANAHNGQTVPGTDLPYIVHISLVSMEILAALAAEPEHDGDLAIQCALLHDVLEDTDIVVEQLEKHFGGTVARGVQALSKNPELPTDQRMRDSLSRIQKQSRAVWMVKLADRITNLQPPPARWSGQKRRTYRAGAKQILDTLGEASPFLAQRLVKKIDSYSQYL